MMTYLQIYEVKHDISETQNLKGFVSTNCPCCLRMKDSPDINKPDTCKFQVKYGRGANYNADNYGHLEACTACWNSYPETADDVP